jgi:hypothetical protein
MKRLLPSVAAAFFFLTGNAWAVYCPVGGAIYHRSGEESAAIARCTEYIKQARASGQKIPDERSWRAAKPWTAIANSQPYPLSWASSGKDSAKDDARKEAAAKQAAAKQASTTRTAAAPAPVEPRKRPPAKPAEERVVQNTPAAKPADAPPIPAASMTEVSPEPSRVVETKPAPSSPVAAAPQAPTPQAEVKIDVTVPGVVPAPAAAVPVAQKDPPVQTERRVALVIGNGKYAAQGPLGNPGNDAEAVSKTLREIGFQSVTTLLDLGRDKIIEALQGFASEADNSDWAVVYYAGHGIEVAGANYLIPVDAKLKMDRDVPFEAVALDHVLNSVESARKLRLVILDACRDNPFVPHMRRTLASRSIGRGLAPIETDRSMLVFFAAKHGQLSLDQIDGQNSPFTTSLVRWMKAPDMEINKVLRHVRDDVLKMTNRTQEPYQYGSLSSEDFFFHPSARAKAN